MRILQTLKIVLITCLCISLVVIYGCATPGTSTVNIIPSPAIDIKNEVFIDQPFETVWDGLVKELAKSFYVINNIEKSSRIINVSFATDTPEEYVDCGTTTRTYERGSEYKEYIYKVSESSSFKLASSTGQSGQFPVTCDMNRKTSLEGRVNIYVAPENNGTRVTVNCRYILKADITGDYVTQNVFGEVIDTGITPPTKHSVSFNTNDDKKSNWGTLENPHYATCHSTGKLETDILNFLE